MPLGGGPTPRRAYALRSKVSDAKSVPSRSSLSHAPALLSSFSPAVVPQAVAALLTVEDYLACRQDVNALSAQFDAVSALNVSRLPVPAEKQQQQPQQQLQQQPVAPAALPVPW